MNILIQMRFVWWIFTLWNVLIFSYYYFWLVLFFELVSMRCRCLGRAATDTHRGGGGGDHDGRRKENENGNAVYWFIRNVCLRANGLRFVRKRNSTFKCVDRRIKHRLWCRKTNEMKTNVKKQKPKWKTTVREENKNTRDWVDRALLGSI